MNPRDLELEIDSLFVDLEQAKHNADREEAWLILNLIHRLKAKHYMLRLNEEIERCK